MTRHPDWTFRYNSGTYSARRNLRVFARTESSFDDQALTASDADSGDRFGDATAVSGSTLVTGAWGDDDGRSKSGSAYVFELGSGGWSEVTKLTASDAAKGDRFGNAVATDAATAVVGAYLADDMGSAYVFERDMGGAGNWGEVTELTPADIDADDNFGFSVAVDAGSPAATTIVVGSVWDDDLGTDSGSAYVYERDGYGNWNQVAKLTASDGAADGQFGFSVAVAGTTIAVGAWTDDAAGTDSGAVYLFERDAYGTWNEAAKLVASDFDANAELGYSVSLSGDRVVAGAPWDDEADLNAGAVYVFERDSAGVWSQVEKILAADITEQLGKSVSASGTPPGESTIAAGAPNMDGAGYNSGSVYLFHR